MKGDQSLNYSYLWLVLGLFTFFRFSYFTTDLYFPDELWHTGYMNNPGKLTNYQGFGLIYWVFGYVISFLGHEFRLVLRILSLASILVASYLIYRANDDKKTKILLVLLFISSPFVWYGGKLITPEFYILPIIIYSYYLLILTNHKKLPFFLSGVCIGIKASIIPAVAPLFLYVLLEERILKMKKVISLISISLITIFGAVFASPNIIWEPEVFFNNIPAKEVQIEYYLNNFTNIWKSKLDLIRSWDLVIFNGFSISVFPLISLSIMLIIFISFFNTRTRLSLLFTLIFYILVMTLQSNYIWHMFSLIPILIFYSIILTKEYKSSFINLSFIVVLIINLYNINIFYHDDKIIRDSIYKDILINRDSHTNCLNSYFSKLNTRENIYVIDTTSILKTRKNIGLLDVEKLMNNDNYQFIQFGNSPGISINSIKNNLNYVYIITHSSYDTMMNFSRNENGDYINSLIVPFVGKLKDRKVAYNCGNININEVIVSDV